MPTRPPLLHVWVVWHEPRADLHYELVFAGTAEEIPPIASIGGIAIHCADALIVYPELFDHFDGRCGRCYEGADLRTRKKAEASA